MKSLPDKEHHSAKGSCGQPPGASQLLASWPFLEIFCSFPSSISRKLCRRLTVNLSLGGGNGSVYNGAGSGSNRWNYAYGVVGRPTTRSGVGGLLLSPRPNHNWSMRLCRSIGYYSVVMTSRAVIRPMILIQGLDGSKVFFCEDTSCVQYDCHSCVNPSGFTWWDPLVGNIPRGKSYWWEFGEWSLAHHCW